MRAERATRSTAKPTCPCGGCDGHLGRCAQPPDDDRDAFEGYCEACYAHLYDPDGKIAMAEAEFADGLEAEFE